MVLEKKQLSKKILAIALSIATMVAFMPMFGNFAYAATAYTVAQPESLELEYTDGQIPDLSSELATIVLNDGTTLKYGKDFTAEAQGGGPEATIITFTTLGNYAGDTIAPMDLTYNVPQTANTYDVEVKAEDFVYDGTPLTAEKVAAATTVLRNGNENIALKTGVDTKGTYSVTLSKSDAVDAGTVVKVTITVNDEPDATLAKVFDQDVTIGKFDLSKAEEVTSTFAEGNTPVYSAEAQEPTAFATVVADGLTVPSTDYDIKAGGYANNVNATTAESMATATIEAKATSKNFTGSAKVPFAIDPFSLENAGTNLTKGAVVEFNGQNQTPEVSVIVGFGSGLGAKEIDKSEYQVVYPEASKAVGKYGVTIKPAEGNVNLTDSKEIAEAFEITKADLSKATITQKNDIVAGTAVSDIAEHFTDYFDVIVNNYRLVLADLAEMDITVDTPATAGTEYNAKIAAKSSATNYKEEKATKYTAAVKPMVAVYQSNATFVYNGQAYAPVAAALGALVGKNDTTATLTTSDYVVSGGWANNTNVGTATANIKGQGKYAGQTAVVEFKIVPLDLSTYDVTISGIKNGTYYAGAEITGATVTAKKGTETLTFTSGTDCTVVAKTFTTGTESKLATVDVSYEGNYTGTKAGVDVSALNVIASIADLDNAVVTGDIPAGLATYNAAAVKKYITVTVDGTAATPAAYNVAITNASAADFGKLDSSVEFTVTPAVEQMIGSKTASAKIVQRDIADLQEGISVAEAYKPVYSGEANEPKESNVIVDPSKTTDAKDAKALVEGTDYTLSYANNTDAGVATVTLTGKGNYKGTATAEFEIGKKTLSSSDFVIDGFTTEDKEYTAGDIADLSSKLTLKDKANPAKLQFVPADYEIKLVEGQKGVAVGDPVKYDVSILATSKNYKSPMNFTVNAYEVTKKTVENADVTIQNTVFPVKDTEVKVADLGTVTVKLDGETMKDADYTVSIEGNTTTVTSELPEGATAPNAVITFQGNYTGKVRTPLTIVAAIIDINEVKLVAPTADKSVYNEGESIVPDVKDAGKHDLVKDNATKGYYTIEYKDADGKVLDAAPCNAGTYTATVVATAKYGGERGESITYTITPKALSKTQFENITKDIIAGSYSYYGEYFRPYVEYLGEKTPAPVLNDDGIDEYADQFEVVEWDKTWDGDTAHKGKATIALKKDANYAYDGTATVDFTWEPGDIDDGEPGDYFEIPDQVYTGKAIEPAVQVKEGCEFSADWVTVKYYENNVNAAEKTAKAFVEVVSPDTEKRYDVDLSGWIVFTIKPAPIADQTIKVANATYAGKAVTPKVTIKDADGALLTLDKDYKVAYKNNTKAGKGTVTVTGIKNYTGETDVQFTINKGVQKITKVTPATKTYKANAKTKKLAAKKTFTLKATATPKKGGGKVTFKKANKVGGAKIKVSKAGKVTVKKGLAKGTYKVKVKATKAANANYKKATKTVTVKIVVK